MAEASMPKALRFLRNWLLLSIPFGIFVGKFIKAGRGHESKDPMP